MSPPFTFGLADKISFPRVSGDEPTFLSASAIPWMFSPRERG